MADAREARFADKPARSLAQVPSEKLNQQFVVLIFGVAAETMPCSLVEMNFGRPATPLQSIPQATGHVDRPNRILSSMAEKKRSLIAFNFDRRGREKVVG